jgi:hypothetical protein
VLATGTGQNLLLLFLVTARQGDELLLFVLLPLAAGHGGIELEEVSID